MFTATLELLVSVPQTLGALCELLMSPACSGASHMCPKQRRVMQLVEAAGDNSAGENPNLLPLPPSHSLPLLPPPARTRKLVAGASPVASKSDISEARHAGEAKMF